MVNQALIKLIQVSVQRLIPTTATATATAINKKMKQSFIPSLAPPITSGQQAASPRGVKPVFPQIFNPNQPFAFIEPPNFNSPELSARMEKTILLSKLNDFKVMPKNQSTRVNQSLTSRNEVVGQKARTQNPSILGKSSGNQMPYLHSVDHRQMKDFLSTDRSLFSGANEAKAEKFQDAGLSRKHVRQSSMHENSSTVKHMMKSTARETHTNQFGSTERQGFAAIHKQQSSNIRVRNQQGATVSDVGGNETVSSIDGRTAGGASAHQWVRTGKEPAQMEAAYRTAINIVQGDTPFSVGKKDAHPISSAATGIRRSAHTQGHRDGRRPSGLSESIVGSNLVATRIPYRQQFGAHNLTQTQDQFTFREAIKREQVSNFNVGQTTPMSPAARQRLALDKVQQMTSKARGQLRAGQPTAKQFAEQMRQRQRQVVTNDYAHETAFVHNNTAKPISSYKFDKFKETHRMRGVEFDQDRVNEEFARRMAKRRSMARREKSAMKQRRQHEGKSFGFKNPAVELYSAEDKARLAKGLKPRLSDEQSNLGAASQQKVSAMSTSMTPNRATNESILTCTDEDEDTIESMRDTSALSCNRAEKLFSQIGGVLDQELLQKAFMGESRRARKYDLYGGKKNIDAYIEAATKKIELNPPEVNISDLADQYYNRDPMTISANDSSQVMFKKTLEQERIRYFDLNKGQREKEKQFMLIASPKPTFHLTRDQQAVSAGGRYSPMKRINEERDYRDYSPPSKGFTLNRYGLQQLQECYRAYHQAHEKILYASKEYKRYNKMKAGETVQISSAQIVTEIRQNPKLEGIARIIEDPLTHALIRMLITYEKYNYEAEEAGIENALNSDLGYTASREDDIFSTITNQPFKEIELMKELVLEFGEVIHERIRDTNEAAVSPSGDGPDPKRMSPRRDGLSPRDDDSHLERLSGKKLKTMTRKNTYFTIDKFIAEHPEFKTIKDEAKSKLIARVIKYKDEKNRKSAETATPDDRSPMGMSDISSPYFPAPASPDSHRYDSPLGRRGRATPQSPLEIKQKSIFEPKRRSSVKRSKLTLQQFVQSTHFQDAFQELIQTLDSQYNQRRDQNKQASQHINKQVFYQLAKESVFSNAAQNPNIDFMNTCYGKKVTPFPIFSKIRGNMLKLIGYSLSDGYCQAMANFLDQQSAEEALIERLVLHNNNVSDQSFASVLTGLLKNSKLRHLHYSLNQLGHKSNAALAAHLKAAFPKQLQSLVLSNLKTTGKALTKSDIEEMEQTQILDDSEVQAVQEGDQSFHKINVIHSLSINLLHTETLMKLVLQDLPLAERAQRNLVLFVEKNSKLENLQLINCQMLPETLAMICVELEQTQNLVNLCFRKNVIRATDKKSIDRRDDFVESLTRLVVQAPALMHLDISGMYIGDDGVKEIVCEGVAESKTLAAVHFQDNKVSHWSRISIYTRLTKSSRKPRRIETSSDNKDETIPADEHTSFDADSQVQQTVGGARESIDTQLFENKGFEMLVNKKGGAKAELDNKLDKDEIGEETLLQNINEVVKANLPIIQFPESQMIIDEELLKEKTSDQMGVHMENVKGGIAQDLVGTLYNRIANNPSLYQDKVERDKYFKDSPWLSISSHQGCWICNANKIIERVSKRNLQSPTPEPHATILPGLKSQLTGI